MFAGNVFLTANLISLLVIGLCKLSVSSCFILGKCLSLEILGKCLSLFVHPFYVVQFVGVCSHNFLYFCNIGYSSSFISYFVYLIPFSFLLGEIAKNFSFF